MESLLIDLQNTNSFDAVDLEATFKACAEKNGIGAGSVMQIFRLAISGQAAGPAIFELTALIGKDKITNRLKLAIDQFNAIV